MGIRERIKQYLDNKNISKYKFYQEMGLSNGFLDKEGNIGSDKCEKISYHYPDINLIWLITGKGEMLNNNEKNLHIIHTPLYTERKVEQSIPLYEFEATAGLTSISNNTTAVPIDYITVPKAPKCDGALFVRGDSMYPILKAGDIVCYKLISDLNNIRFGEIYLLDIDDGDDQYLTIKYVQKSDKGDEYIKLVSYNQNHCPKDEKKTNVRAIALVKLSIRYNEIT